MKTSRTNRFLLLGLLAALISFTVSAFGDDAAVDMLNKAYDLVHQARNPGGDPPSVAEQTGFLNKALDLTEKAPNHHLKGTRAQAALDIKAALDMLKSGNTGQGLDDLLRKASDELRDAVSLAQ